MPPKPQRDYWDANVFLSLFQSGHESHLFEQRDNAIRLLEDARRGVTVIVTSTFTLVEARRGEGVPPLPGEEHATLKAFFKHPYIEVVPLDRAIAELAAEYGDRFGLKNGDAVQLATAVRSKVSRLLAWDGDFHRKVAMREAPIKIEYPWRPPDPQMDMIEAIEGTTPESAEESDGEIDELVLDELPDEEPDSESELDAESSGEKRDGN
jgi:predicted nucleic acid-binding protein